MLGCDDGSVRVWRDVSSSSSSDALDSQSSHGNSNMGSSHGGNHMTASSQHMMSYHGGTVGATGSAGTNVNSSGSTVNNAVELVSSFSALPDVAEISRGYVCTVCTVCNKDSTIIARHITTVLSAYNFLGSLYNSMYVILQKNILSLPGGTILMDLCICIYMPTLSIIFAYIKSHDPNYYVSVCMYTFT